LNDLPSTVARFIEASNAFNRKLLDIAAIFLAAP
jgi:hypothetical protein